MAYVAPRAKERSRALREQLTDAERRLWLRLRRRQLNGWRFRRQHPIEPYIVDFACVETKLVVEAGGGQHNNSESDRLRDAGWRILRFLNTDILTNTSGVIESILSALRPLPSLPHATRRGGS